MGIRRFEVLDVVARRERRGWRRSTESDVADALIGGRGFEDAIRSELDLAERDGLVRAVGRDYAGEPQYVLTGPGELWLEIHGADSSK